MNHHGIKCLDCKGTAPKVNIPAFTVMGMFGRCRGCLYAPECETCGAHSVADGADIKMMLCGGCRAMMQSVKIPNIDIPAPVPNTPKRPIRSVVARLARA